MPIRKQSLRLLTTYQAVIETNRSYLLSQNVVGRDFWTYDPSLSFYYQPTTTSTDANSTDAMSSLRPMKLRGSGSVYQAPTGSWPGVPAQDMYLLGNYGKYSPYVTTGDSTYEFLPSATVCQVQANGSLVRLRQGLSFFNNLFDANRQNYHVFYEDDTAYYLIEKCEYVTPAAASVYQTGIAAFTMGKLSKTDWTFTVLSSGNTTYAGFPCIVKETAAGILFYPASRGTYNAAGTINAQSVIYFNKTTKTTSVLAITSMLTDSIANAQDSVNPTVSSLDTTNSGSDKFYMMKYVNGSNTYQIHRVAVDSNVTSTGSMDASSQYTRCTFTNVPADVSMATLMQTPSVCTMTGGTYSNVTRFLHYFKDSSGAEYLALFIHQTRDGSNVGFTNLTPGSEYALFFKINSTSSAVLEFKQIIRLPANTVGVIPSADSSFFLTVTPYSMQLLNWVVEAGEASRSVQVNVAGRISRSHLDPYNQIWINYDNVVEVYHPSVSKYVKLTRQNSDQPIQYVDTPITTNMLVGVYDITGHRVAQDVTLKAVNCTFNGGVTSLTITTTTGADNVVPITISGPGSISVIVTDY